MRILIIISLLFFGQKKLTIQSADFADTHAIPSKFTCDAQNLSPALIFSNSPKKTKSFALIMDDTESPNGEFVHWVLFNIPPTTEKIAENSFAGTQGKNTLGQNKYFGPCPPNGIHTYNFKLYALDAKLEIGSESGKAELLKAMNGHILAEAILKGTYKRQ